MKNYLYHIGIDVSKLTLDVNIFDAKSQKSEHFVIENTTKSITSFVKLIKKRVVLNQTLFCCENTGVYTNHLSFTLSKLQMDLWDVPAIEIKRSKGISRGKSDRTDAKDIALYSFRNLDKLKLFSVSEINIQKLKLLFTEREKVLKALLLLESTKENEGFVDRKVLSVVSGINKSLVNVIKKSLQKIEFSIKEIFKSDEELKKQNQLIQSIPGIGDKTSTYLIIATKGFTAFENWRKLACYSGIAPFEYSSGTSIKGRTKVNHMADKKLKSLLQMCAMTAIKSDPQIKAYFERKKLEGKNPMLVLNNIRCKLISRVFAVIKRGTPFINTYKYAS